MTGACRHAVWSRDCTGRFSYAWPVLSLVPGRREPYPRSTCLAPNPRHKYCHGLGAPKREFLLLVVVLVLASRLGVGDGNGVRLDAHVTRRRPVHGHDIPPRPAAPRIGRAKRHTERVCTGESQESFFSGSVEYKDRSIDRRQNQFYFALLCSFFPVLVCDR